MSKKVRPADTIQVMPSNESIPASIPSANRKPSQENIDILDSHGKLEEHKHPSLKDSGVGLKGSLANLHHDNESQMADAEVELEHLTYDDKDESLRDEIGSELNDNKADDDQGKNEGEGGAKFERQLSGLKQSRMNKNQFVKQETIVRDASHGLSYTRMLDRRERSHVRRLVDGKFEKYPY